MYGASSEETSTSVVQGSYGQRSVSEQVKAPQLIMIFYLLKM